MKKHENIIEYRNWGKSGDYRSAPYEYDQVDDAMKKEGNGSLLNDDVMGERPTLPDHSRHTNNPSPPPLKVSNELEKSKKKMPLSQMVAKTYKEELRDKERKHGEPTLNLDAWNKTASSLEALSTDDANPIRIKMLLDEAWGDDWLDWEPETIAQTAEQDGFSISKISFDKIFSLRLLEKTDLCENDPRVFEKVCVAFASRPVDWGIIQDCSLPEICGAVALIKNYVKRDVKFSSEVKTYIAGVALFHGYILLPPLVRFADGEFSIELAIKLGDDVIEIQNNLREVLRNPSFLKTVPEDYQVQFVRLLKCQDYAQQLLDGVIDE